MGDIAGQRQRSGRGGHGVGGFDIVLYQDGNAVKGAAPLALV